MEKRRTKEWYCWVIVAACLLLSAASIGMLSYFNALFVTPVCESLHIARSSFSLMSTFSTVTTMLLLPFVGKLYDHIPMKLLVLLGAIAGGCAHLCYSLAQNTILFYLGGILSGIGACLAGAAPITLLLANWFEEKRGLATGIAFTGSSLVSSLLSPVVSSLIGTYGWRVGYRCIAAGLVLTILAALLLIRPTPAAMGLLPYGGKRHEKLHSLQADGLSQRGTLRQPSYWLLAVGIFLFGLMTAGTQQQLVSYWRTESISQEIAVQMYSIVLLAGVAGKMLVGYIYDRFSVPIATIFCGITAACAYLSLWLCLGERIVMLPAVLFGLSTALQVILPSYLTKKLFGSAAFLSNVGLITTILYLGSSVGAPACAFIFDRSGSYAPAWLLYALLSTFAAAAILAANQLAKARPAQRSSREA